MNQDQFKNETMPSLSWRYSLFLALRDLWHNKLSSFSLISVICFVCLPLLILGTLREKYVGRLIEKIEQQSNAKCIVFLQTADYRKKIEITPEYLQELRQNAMVAFVKPILNTSIMVPRNGILQNYITEGVLADDPLIKMRGSKDSVSDSISKGIILTRAQWRMFGEKKIGDTFRFYVERSVIDEMEKFPIDCTIIDTVKSDETSTYYIPLNLANDLKLWSNGYAIPRLHLPASPNHENTLGLMRYPRCRFYPFNNKVTAIDSSTLRSLKLDIEKPVTENAAGKVQLYYTIKKKDDLVFSWNDWKEIQDMFLVHEPVIIPDVEQVECAYGNQKFSLQSTLGHDPHRLAALDKGRWFGPNEDRFHIVLPRSFAASIQKLPQNISIEINSNRIKATVIGLSNTGKGYGLPELVYRLGQVASGNAVYDGQSRTFAPQAQEASAHYVSARVYAASLEDVIPLETWLKEQGFETMSSSSEIVDILRIKKMITNLVLLIGITSFFAVILATIGIMFEAILRKKKQIGIMRTIGVPSRAVVRLFMIESSIYAVIGYLAANVLQIVFATIADSPQMHRILGLEIDKSVFDTSLALRILLGIFLLVLTNLSGYIPARYAGRIEPGIVLMDQEA